MSKHICHICGNQHEGEFLVYVPGLKYPFPPGTRVWGTMELEGEQAEGPHGEEWSLVSETYDIGQGTVRYWVAPPEGEVDV